MQKFLLIPSERTVFSCGSTLSVWPSLACLPVALSIRMACFTGPAVKGGRLSWAKYSKRVSQPPWSAGRVESPDPGGNVPVSVHTCLPTTVDGCLGQRSF